MLYEIDNWFFLSVGLTDIASLIHYLMEHVAKEETFCKFLFFF